MRTLRAVAAIPAALLVFGALTSCSSAGSTASTNPAPVATAAPIGSAPPSSAPDTTPASTTPAAATEPPTTGTAPAGPQQIDVLVGVDDSPDRVERVQLGSSVTLNITNPDAADEYHLHGYDIEQQVPKGVTATINFTADQAGTFEVESHDTNKVLLQIQVG
jgi:hypothetical protein